MGDKLCIYPILVGDDKGGKKLMDGLAKIGGCGFAVNAADISSPNAMADYVKKVFLAPAAPKVAAAPAPAAVLDSDGDGVPDSRDKCPGTPKGVKVNADGCWELKGVNFDSDKSVIKDTRVLDDAVVIMKANPTLTGEVRGYTDSTASEGTTRSSRKPVPMPCATISSSRASRRSASAPKVSARPIRWPPTIHRRDAHMNRRVELHPDPVK